MLTRRRKVHGFCTGEQNLLTPHGNIFIYDASPHNFKIQLLISKKSRLKYYLATQDVVNSDVTIKVIFGRPASGSTFELRSLAFLFVPRRAFPWARLVLAIFAWRTAAL